MDTLLASNWWTRLLVSPIARIFQNLCENLEVWKMSEENVNNILSISTWVIDSLIGTSFVKEIQILDK